MSDLKKPARQTESDSLLDQETSAQVEQLPSAICAHMNKWLERYPKEHKRSGVFEALRLVQEHNKGYLTVPWMNAVAEFLEMPRIAVYEVATFYTMFRLSPVGQHVIELCTNVSCMLSGAEETLKVLKARLGIDVDGTTADGKFTLKEVECLGACVAAPACQVGKRYIEKLTPEKVDELLSSLS